MFSCFYFLSWLNYYFRVSIFYVDYCYSSLDPNSPDAASFTPTTDQVISDLDQSKDEFRRFSIYTVIISFSIFYNCIQKIFYNLLATHKIPIDKWTKLDILCSFCNISCVYFVLKYNDGEYLDSNMKNYLDYYVIFVMQISWSRFFIYALMQKPISVLLLTLYEIMYDAMSFLLILGLYILVVACIFTTLYQDVCPDKYGSIITSYRILYDAGIGTYDYSCMDARVLDHSALFMIHTVFMNILLLNYLVAILSTTYENMQQSGIFKYKINLYNYCESYMCAFKEEGYGEFITHPPPISGLCVILVPFVLYKKSLIKMAKILSYSIFWGENLIFMLFFFIYEIAIIPIVFIKVFLNIIRCSEAFFIKLKFCAYWALSGIFLLIYFTMNDMLNLVKILAMHDGCQTYYKTEEKQKEVDIDQRMNIYNSVIRTLRGLINRIKFYIEHQSQMEEMKYQNHEISFNTRSNATPTVDNRHASFMSRYKSDNDESKESAFKDEQIECLESNTKEFIKSKQEIIRQWKDDVKAYRDKKLKRKVKPTEDNSKSRNPYNKILDVQHQSDNESEINDNVNVTDEELTIANEFLEKFVLESESSIDGHIDLILVIKSLPDYINKNTYSRAELFKFRVFQNSLIAHQNADIVDAFEYFDERNKDRVYSIKEKLSKQKEELESIRSTLSSQVLTKISSKSSEQETQSYKRDEKLSSSHRIISASNNREEVKRKINFNTEQRNEGKKRPSSYIASNQKIKEKDEEED